MMIKRLDFSRLLCWLAIGLVLGCATPGSPSGGPRDEIPPQVIQEESSPNPMTNFDLTEIRITFDEWITLRDPATQIVISPPVEPRITPKIDRKSVVIPIVPQNLRDGTTYVINFGEAVQDITERNATKDLLYVFSTGPYVDSLTLSGKVFDARSGEGAPDVRVILHDNPSDTAISKLLPSYFSSTDEGGNFTLRFLRSDTFRVYAVLEGEFGNYRYDFGELFGFLKEPVFISDTMSTSVSIPLFMPRVPLQLITSAAGVPQKLAFTREVQNPAINADSAVLGNIPYWRTVNDTIYFWYTGVDTVELTLLENSEPFDTVRLIPQQFEEVGVNLNMLTGPYHPDEAVRFTSDHPVGAIDASRINILQGDTLPLTEFEWSVDSNDITALALAAPWQPEGRYTLQFLPGAVENIFGNSHDTTRMVVRFPTGDDFATLNLSIEGLVDSVQYLIELLENELVRDEMITMGLDSLGWALPRLPVKEYEVRIIEDLNSNGYWDTGDLETKRQPERIFTVAVDGMRPGWDLDFAIRWPEE